jgi:hypothetical protein
MTEEKAAWAEIFGAASADSGVNGFQESTDSDSNDDREVRPDSGLVIPSQLTASTTLEALGMWKDLYKEDKSQSANSVLSQKKAQVRSSAKPSTKTKFERINQLSQPRLPQKVGEPVGNDQSVNSSSTGSRTKVDPKKQQEYLSRLAVPRPDQKISSSRSAGDIPLGSGGTSSSKAKHKMNAQQQPQWGRGQPSSRSGTHSSGDNKHASKKTPPDPKNLSPDPRWVGIFA